MKTIMTVLTFIFLALTSSTLGQQKDETCEIKGHKLYGKIQFVESFPDITVEVVERFEDLRVEIVENFANECGEWEIVASFPDLKVKIVENFADIKIKFVESYPGIR